MIKEKMVSEYKAVSKALFLKGFFHIYHGSISLRTDDDKFMINQKDELFSEPKLYTEVHYQRDLSWNDSSKDTEIHAIIYQKIPMAKCIAHIFPTSLVTYSLFHRKIKPIDYFGDQLIGTKPIHDFKAYSDWEDQADAVIATRLKDDNIMIIKGFGAFIWERNLKQLAKKASILENSAKILLTAKQL